jgi:hypothetical protein
MPSNLEGDKQKPGGLDQVWRVGVAQPLEGVWPSGARLQIPPVTPFVPCSITKMSSSLHKPQPELHPRWLMRQA